MQDLNNFIPIGTGWSLLREANAINSSGYITGLGTINGQEHAFLMTPTVVPEPISCFLFVAGGLTLAFKRFYRRIKLPYMKDLRY